MSFLANLPHNVFIGLVYLAMLLVLVAAHEYGHYLFARLFGMGAEEFALGMGGKPLVFGRRRYLVPIEAYQDPENRGGANRLEDSSSTVPAEVVETPKGLALRETTLFTLRPWPLGGFVRIKGMVPDEDGAETQIPGGFFSKSPLKRWVVLAAGPAFSALAGVLLLFLVLSVHGVPTPTGHPIMGELRPGDAAARAGFQKGDRVLSVDGAPTSTWFDIVKNVRDKGAKPMTVVAERDGKTFTKVLKGDVDKEPTPVANADNEQAEGVHDRIQTKLGVYAESTVKPFPPGKALKAAVLLPYVSTMDLIGRFAHPKELADSVGGPGTMIQATSDAVDEGAWAVVRLAGLLSISVGIFNLLPFPPLDGGQMWIAFVEMLRGGRRLSWRTQVRVINLGLAMVMLLIGAVLVIDFRRLTGLSGEKASSAKP